MQLQLTAMLLRPTATPVSALTESSRECMDLRLWSDGDLERIGPEDAELTVTARADELVIALFERATEPPAWQQFLNQALGEPRFVGTPASRGAVVFCPIDGAAGRRWLAWCFGSGWQSLRRAAIDPRFGLLGALNALAALPESSDGAGGGAVRTATRSYLRDVWTRSMLGPRQRSAHRAARSVPLEAFGVDRRSQVIGLVGGRSRDPLLGTVKGGRSLAFRGRLEHIEELRPLSSKLLERAGSDRYKTNFGWVDRLTLVEDDDVRQALTEQLADEVLAHEEKSDVDVMLPDDLPEDDDRSITHVAFPGQRKESVCEGVALTIERVAALIGHWPDRFQRAQALQQSLRFLDEVKEEIGKATILECLAADLTWRGERYVAHEGDFFRVKESVVEEVNQELHEVLRQSSLQFPCYHGGPEPEYNQRAADDPTRFVCLDNEFLRLPGETQIELCDLVADTGALVYVKRKGRSSVLSHLFLQAANACDVLRHSKPARKRLAEMIQASVAAPALIEAARKALASLERRDGASEVVFALLEVRSDRITDLPFFSKVSLVQVALTLARLGYQPSYKLIKTCQTGHPLGRRITV